MKRMADKRRRIFFLFIIVLAFVAIAGVVFIVHSAEKSKLHQQLDLGQKYLEELQYEQAIVCFNKVIEIDPMNADAYLGMADAYIGLGDYEKAEEILRRGIDLLKTAEETYSADLNRLMNRLQEIQDAVSGVTMEDAAAEEQEIEAEPQIVHAENWISAPLLSEEALLINGKGISEYSLQKLREEFGCIVFKSSYQDENGTQYEYYEETKENGVVSALFDYNNGLKQMTITGSNAYVFYWQDESKSRKDVSLGAGSNLASRMDGVGFLDYQIDSMFSLSESWEEVMAKLEAALPPAVAGHFTEEKTEYTFGDRNEGVGTIFVYEDAIIIEEIIKQEDSVNESWWTFIITFDENVVHQVRLAKNLY